MNMNNLKKLALLAITVGVLHSVTGCQPQGDIYGQDYNYSNNPMMVNNNSTIGTIQIDNNTMTEYEQEERRLHVPKLKSALNGYNAMYEDIIYDNCLSSGVNPYLITVLIKFQTVNGTSYACNITNNLFGYADKIDFSNNHYGDEILKQFNSKSESILYTINKLQNTYTREYNLMSIEEIVEYLYPEWERYNKFEDTKERYERIITSLYRDYKELKGEKYNMRGEG